MGKPERLRIPYPVVVEGKHDGIRLSGVMEGLIVTTDGFALFRRRERQALLRRLSEASPLIVLTDSDGGGRVIRSFLSGLIPADRLIQVRIPEIRGRERRKRRPSAAGTLGVEGMDEGTLRSLLLPFALPDGAVSRWEGNPLSMADLMEDGLTGRRDSARRRDALCAAAGLPPGMGAGALLRALRMILTYEEYLTAAGRGTAEGGGGRPEPPPLDNPRGLQ